MMITCAKVLEACVKNCGQRFHQELGKFKFLNEIIRMLSPKVSFKLQYVIILSCYQPIVILEVIFKETFSFMDLH